MSFPRQTVSRRHRPPRARFAPRSPPRSARAAGGVLRVSRCTALRESASATAPLPRTAPGTRARAPAEPARTSPGTAPRTSRRTRCRSIAAAAPIRRVPRRRFPHRSYRRFGRLYRPGRPWVPHPTQQAAGVRMRAQGVRYGTPVAVFGRLRATASCWIERVSRATRPSSSPCPRAAPPVAAELRADISVLRWSGTAGAACHPRNTAQHARNTCETRAKHVRNTCEFRLGGRIALLPGADYAPSAAFRRSDSWNSRASATSLSSSSPRPSRTIASRLSVARNQV